jgi:hypothetical protein
MSVNGKRLMTLTRASTNVTIPWKVPPSPTKRDGVWQGACGRRLDRSLRWASHVGGRVPTEARSFASLRMTLELLRMTLELLRMTLELLRMTLELLRMTLELLRMPLGLLRTTC